MNEKFKHDLKTGEKYEDLMVSVLTKIGFTYVKHSQVSRSNQHHEYDLMMRKGISNKTFEIKSDLFSFETDNEIFELKCFGKTSGILRTQSDYWITIYVLDNKIVIYKTKDLQDLVKECMKGTEEIDFRITNGGDKDASKLLLINKYDLEKWSDKYNIQRLVINQNIPLYDIENIIIHFENKKRKYYKIINKLKSML